MATTSTQSTPRSTKAKDAGHGRSGALAPVRSRTPAPNFGPLNRLRSEFDRLFDDFFGGWTGWTEGASAAGGVEVRDLDDALVVRADAPGFDADDFDVQIRGDNLVLCACQSEETAENEDGGIRWEKRELYRSVPLPAEVDVDKIDARYRNGVLEVKLPKSEQAKGRKIEVKK